MGEIRIFDPLGAKKTITEIRYQGVQGSVQKFIHKGTIVATHMGSSRTGACGSYHQGAKEIGIRNYSVYEIRMWQ